MKSAIRAFSTRFSAPPAWYTKEIEQIETVARLPADLRSSNPWEQAQKPRSQQTNKTNGQHWAPEKRTPERRSSPSSCTRNGRTIYGTDERFVRWTNDLLDGRTLCWTDESYVARMDNLLDGRTKPNEGYGRKVSSTLGPLFLSCEFSFGKLN